MVERSVIDTAFLTHPSPGALSAALSADVVRDGRRRVHDRWVVAMWRPLEVCDLYDWWPFETSGWQRSADRWIDTLRPLVPRRAARTRPKFPQPSYKGG